MRSDRGAAVVEFPMVAVLIVLIGLAIIQASLIVHTRNSLVDAAVQGAHFGALAGSDPEDGAQRAEELLERRYGDALGAEATAVQDPDGTIHVRVTATLPLVGLLGPSGTLAVEGRALDEEQW
ncbi:TadE family protein [Brachybacterium sp. J153]|nr:TadE family protein [Brachybacterium sp. J153]MEE1616937.1 TadE family protein [Brachybacterium sp. J153]